MALRIFNNLNSNIAQRLLGTNNDKLSRTFARISSGLRINSSSDDAAGLAISEFLKSDTRVLQQGVRNLNDAVALTNIADGALAEQTSILIRMRELASQAATGTIGATERQTINLEFTAIRKEFDRISASAVFNGIKVLDGSVSSGSSIKVVVQLGLTSADTDRIDLNRDVNITKVSSSALGLFGLSVATISGALNALEPLSDGINTLTEIRARVGAVQNRFSSSLNNLNSSIQNLTAAGSRIRDADLALELANLTKQQILVQTSSAMVGQANLFPQGVLTLLQ